MGPLSPRVEPVAGWGRRPVRPGRVARPDRLCPVAPAEPRILGRGLGRAYGDAAVPSRDDALVLETGRADRILGAFDAAV